MTQSLSYELEIIRTHKEVSYINCVPGALGTELFLNGISRQMGLASHTCRRLRVGTTEVKVRTCLVAVPTVGTRVVNFQTEGSGLEVLPGSTALTSIPSMCKAPSLVLRPTAKFRI